MSQTDAGSAQAAHVGGYLAAAKQSIDREFGAGFAKANPQLVAAFLSACAADRLAEVLSDKVGAGLGEVGAGLQNVGSGLLSGSFGR